MEPPVPTEGFEASLARTRLLIGRGEFLEVYDEASRALGDRQPRGPAEVELAYLSTLALARSGATDRAERQLDHYDLLQQRQLPTRLAEDIGSLRARIAKDRALGAPEPARAELAGAAAQLYEGVHDAFGGAYPCINAATMWLLAGDRARARRLADRALVLSEEGDEYWTVATRAEAHLLRDETEAAAAALASADARSKGEYATRATTKRQLELICGLTGADPSVLAALGNPRVVHFAGHRLAPEGRPGRFPAIEEERVVHAVEGVLSARDVGVGFGSLASGSDIIVAEQLLARGAELHVVLPFSIDEFVEVSVADSGRPWVDRFHACLGAADTVRFASDSDYLDDPAMFDFCSAVAMGEAVNRARDIGSDVEMVVVWDGEPAGEARVGTAVDIERWRALGLPVSVVDSRSNRRDDAAPASTLRAVAEREVRAMLFADVAGFSKLGDGEIPTFMEQVMGTLGACVDGYAGSVLLRKTWGDGIYLVFVDVEGAADCALEMQTRMRAIDLEACGLGMLRGMRIGVHVGPVFEGWDHVRRELTFFGANVTRAARIEPRTPEGEVYVTHPFAALVALTQRQDLRCHYVGRLPAAKDYGVLPMYVLKRTD